MRDATKLITTGPTSCLDGHSAHDSQHVTSQLCGVSVFWKIAFTLCSPKPATQCNVRRHPSRRHFLPSGRISAGQRALDQKASRWDPSIFRHSDRAAEYLFDDLPRLRRRQGFAKKSNWTVHVSIENFSKQLPLVPKCGVKTRSIDSHGPGEIGKRSPFIAFGPKNTHGAIQHRVGIEGARPPKPCSVFRFHTNR